MSSADPSPALKIAEEISGACLGLRARRINRDVTRIFDSALSPLGLTGAQMTLLAAVQLTEPVPSGALGTQLGLEKSTVSRNLKLMEENGWVRLRDDQNRRVVSLTASGRRLLSRAHPIWQNAQNEVRELLGDELSHVLGRVPATGL